MVFFCYEICRRGKIDIMGMMNGSLFVWSRGCVAHLAATAMVRRSKADCRSVLEEERKREKEKEGLNRYTDFILGVAGRCLFGISALWASSCLVALSNS